MAHPYYSEKVFDQARHDSSLAVSHAMRSTGQHELSDRRNRSRISPVAELDTKLRNPQRRRVPLAVGFTYPLPFWGHVILTLDSAADVDAEKSNAAATTGTDKPAPTAAVPATRIASSYE